jgi:hypothetical protein
MHIFEEIVRGKTVRIRDSVWRFDDNATLVSPSDPLPRDPCWCYSDKLFESCHMVRHQQSPVSREAFGEGWEKAADIEMCLHPSAPDGCSPRIVHAHTVQRMGGGLRRIAVGGEVYGMKLHPYFVQKNGGRVVPEKIGLRKASTFRGFCQNHDAGLFRPVETARFTASPEQLVLLNFRAIARRVYGRQVALRHTMTMFGYDRGLLPRQQRMLFALQEGERLHAEETLGNIRNLKTLYDERILHSNFSDLNAFVLVFAGAPEVAFAEIVGIDANFTGCRLVHPAPPSHLIVYTVAVEDHWVVVFSWLGPNSAAEELCGSLAARADNEKPSIILRYAVEYVDNLFLSPRWWDSLPQSDRSDFINALTSRMHPLYVRHPAVLENRGFVATTASYAGSFAVGPWATAAA